MTCSVRNGPIVTGSRHVETTIARTTAQSPTANRNARPSGRRSPGTARTTHQHDQNDQDDERRDPLVGLRRVRRQRRRERAPRPLAEVRGRPIAGPRLALAGPAEDHRELARADDEQDGQRGDVHPAADVAVEQGGHDRRR